MSRTALSDDIVIRVDTIAQLFRPPEVNPFAANEIYVLGESALTRASRRLLGRRPIQRKNARLVIQLPESEVTPDIERRTVEAVRRYTDAKIEDNNLTLRLSRTRGLIGLLIVSIISIVVITLTSLLLNSVLSDLSESAQGFILSFVGIFAWVMLWDPLSKLLFEWVEPWLQNRMFHQLRTLPLVIWPQPVPNTMSIEPPPS